MKFEGPAGNVLVLLEYLLIRENLKKKNQKFENARKFLKIQKF